MPWVEIFAVFVVSHLAGDYLLQTDWQAKHKRGGFSTDPVRRRALLSHIATYMLAYVPALIWLADDIGAWIFLVATAIALPHSVQDDGRLVAAYVRRVKGIEPTESPLVMAVDQSLHVIALFAVAVVIGG